MKPRKIEEVLRLSAIALFLGGLFACIVGLFATDLNSITKIDQLQKKRDINSTVYLKGKVIKQIPLLGARAYELQDSTGTVFVVTKEEFPSQKEEVFIKGKVQYKSIPLGGSDLGEVYVTEQERL